LSASFSSRRISGVIIIDVAGRVTLGAPSNGMRESIEGALKNGAAGILLNLADVDYIDSSGIGELVSGLRRAKLQGASLKLLNVSRRIQDLLKLTKVFPLFECVDHEASDVSRTAPEKRAVKPARRG
jgi:anti-sigma B factor antagonist